MPCGAVDAATGFYDFFVQETDSERTVWILFNIMHSWEQSGKAVLRKSHSRQGLLTRCPISKSNRHLNRMGVRGAFISVQIHLHDVDNCRTAGASNRTENIPQPPSDLKHCVISANQINPTVAGMNIDKAITDVYTAQCLKS